MAWTTPELVTTGQLITAAFWNAQVKGNFDQTAPGVVTTAGDLVYASGANALARLAIGTATQVLGSTGSAPAWVTNVMVLLAEETLGSNAASVTISSISVRAHKYVLLEMMLSTTNSGGDLLEVILNQDAAANYHGQRMSAKDTTVDAARGAGSAISAEVERGFGQVVIRLASPLNQRTRWWTENLGAVWTGDDPALAESLVIDVVAGLWKNTADVIRLDIGMLIGDLRAGSVIRLWGVR